MLISSVKPENCTCGFPKDKYATHSKHSLNCPMNSVFWENKKIILMERMREMEETEFKNKKYLGYSDNVE
jgi:hypothetical protein